MDFLWDHASSYYILSVMFTLAFVMLTCILEHKVFPSLPAAKSGRKHPTWELDLKKKQPLLLAKKIKESLPKELRAMEKRVQEKQLAAIYDLMKNQQEHFGETSLEEMKDQLKLYGF